MKYVVFGLLILGLSVWIITCFVSIVKNVKRLKEKNKNKGDSHNGNNDSFRDN